KARISHGKPPSPDAVPPGPGAADGPSPGVELTPAGGLPALPSPLAAADADAAPDAVAPVGSADASVDAAGPLGAAEGATGPPAVGDAVGWGLAFCVGAGVGVDGGAGNQLREMLTSLTGTSNAQVGIEEPLQGPAVQPPNTDPVAGAAVNVRCEESARVCLQT